MLPSNDAYAILALCQAAARNGDYAPIDAKSLDELRRASYQLHMERGSGAFSVLQDRIRLKEAGEASAPPRARAAEQYVNGARLSELRTITSGQFDLRKLVRLCEELNDAYDNDAFYSVGMLVRAICDHVPPIFGCQQFGDVANHYPGSQSFRKGARALDQSLRNLADGFLHEQVRRAEALPNATSVAFAPGLDLVLGEVCRILRTAAAAAS